VAEIGFGEPLDYDSEHHAIYDQEGMLFLDNVADTDAVRRIVACINALAGLNPAALGELIAAIDYMKRGYQLWLAPECPPEEVGSPSWLERQERVFAALAKLRGTGGGG